MIESPLILHLTKSVDITSIINNKLILDSFYLGLISLALVT